MVRAMTSASASDAEAAARRFRPGARRLRRPPPWPAPADHRRASSLLRAGALARAPGPVSVAARPEASAMSASLVLVSPSTLARLNVCSATRTRAPWSARASAAASVKRKASIVACGGRGATVGWIMPAPLAMPKTTNGRPPISPCAWATFGPRSVVRIASAKRSARSGARSAQARGRARPAARTVKGRR